MSTKRKIIVFAGATSRKPDIIASEPEPELELELELELASQPASQPAN